MKLHAVCPFAPYASSISSKKLWSVRCIVRTSVNICAKNHSLSFSHMHIKQFHNCRIDVWVSFCFCQTISFYFTVEILGRAKATSSLLMRHDALIYSNCCCSPNVNGGEQNITHKKIVAATILLLFALIL